MLKYPFKSQNDEPMRYQITEQYARGEEHFIAEFARIEDSCLFKRVKVSEAEDEHRAALYRSYKDSDLIDVANPQGLCVSRAQYADSDRSIGMSQPLTYSLILRTKEAEYSLACFDAYADVQLFLLQRAIDEHHHLDDEDVFCLFKHRVLIETFPLHMLRAASHAEGHPLTGHFNPTPTPTTLKPPGFPQDHWCDDEESDEKRN